ncbi:hypothetical protein GQ457_09G012310 [Hibiscus cannabinus]
MSTKGKMIIDLLELGTMQEGSKSKKSSTRGLCPRTKRAMAIEDRLITLEMNHKGMQDRLDKMEKELKDEIAQAQRNTVSQIAERRLKR